MWTRKELAAHLREIGITPGMAVLAHTSLRAVGPMEDGAATLLAAFRDTLGPEGTLLVPTFTDFVIDPAEWRKPPQTPEELERLRAEAPLFDRERTPADVRWMGVFPEFVRRQPDALRSDHPALSFAAIGKDADFLTRQAPFHFPLGSESPLARLHQCDGSVLLIGVGHDVNSSLHLAEVWAEAPYIQRSTNVKTGPDHWTTLRGSPECSDGFPKIEPMLRQARLLQRGQIGNAPSQRMRQRELVSMAIALLKGDSAGLLCNDLACPWCRLARKFTADQYTP